MQDTVSLREQVQKDTNVHDARLSAQSCDSRSNSFSIREEFVVQLSIHPDTPGIVV